jgi:hypothetical protein
VDNETGERRSAATKVSAGERRREINKVYFCVTALEILYYELVRNIYPIREHRIPIRSLLVQPPTVASR